MKAYIFALFSVLCWSFNVIAAQVLEKSLTPWQIAFCRWIIPACILFVICFSQLKKYKDVIWKYKGYLAGLALVGITISNTCVYYATRTSDPITLSVIGATGPVFLIVFDCLLGKKKINLFQFVGLVITLLGCMLIVTNGRLSHLSTLHLKWGDFWMLGTAITFGLYGYYVSRCPKEIPNTILLTMPICLGALFCIPMFVYDTWQNPLIIGQNMTTAVILILLYMGLFNSLLAYITWNDALRVLGAFKTGMAYYLMPIFSTIEAWLIFHDTLHTAQVMGGSLILSGILLSKKENGGYKKT